MPLLVPVTVNVYEPAGVELLVIIGSVTGKLKLDGKPSVAPCGSPLIEIEMLPLKPPIFVRSSV